MIALSDGYFNTLQRYDSGLQATDIEHVFDHGVDVFLLDLLEGVVGKILGEFDLFDRSRVCAA